MEPVVQGALLDAFGSFSVEPQQDRRFGQALRKSLEGRVGRLKGDVLSGKENTAAGTALHRLVDQKLDGDSKRRGRAQGTSAERLKTVKRRSADWGSSDDESEPNAAESSMKKFAPSHTPDAKGKEAEGDSDWVIADLKLI